MKIGIFDSGLGGLIVMSGIVEALPQYDYVYLGDTARVPYGNRSQQTVYEFTKQAIEALFAKDCALVIVACNTASAEALRRFQEQELQNYPNRKVLGVLVPAAEAAVAATKTNRIGVLATAGTVHSGAFAREIKKMRPNAEVFQHAAPLLVPLIENNGVEWAPPILASYLEPLLRQNIDTLILGCTHYPALRKEIEAIVGPDVAIIAQNECVPPKLQDYVSRHPEVARQLSRHASQVFYVTDHTPSYQSLGATLFKKPLMFDTIEL